MSFNPQQPIRTEEDKWAYAAWCHDRLRVSIDNDETIRSYRNAFDAAAKLWVTAAVPLCLHPDEPKVHRANLAGLWLRARCVERMHTHVKVSDVMVARAVVDCFKPVGRWAPWLVEAAKCAIAAVILIHTTVLSEPWELDAPDVWALVLYGDTMLATIPGDTSHEEFTVRVDQSVVDKMMLQNVNQLSRSIGAPPISPN